MKSSLLPEQVQDAEMKNKFSNTFRAVLLLIERSLIKR